MGGPILLYGRLKERLNNMSEYLDFVLINFKPKTCIYNVQAKGTGDILGTIKWYPAWRHYCFFPSGDAKPIFSDRCLIAIANFITKLNHDHKGGLSW
jgi:hypothetical protein